MIIHSQMHFKLHNTLDNLIKLLKVQTVIKIPQHNLHFHQILHQLNILQLIMHIDSKTMEEP